MTALTERSIKARRVVQQRCADMRCKHTTEMTRAGWTNGTGPELIPGLSKADLQNHRQRARFELTFTEWDHWETMEEMRVLEGARETLFLGHLKEEPQP